MPPGWRWNEVTPTRRRPLDCRNDSVGHDRLDSQSRFFGAPGPSILNQWTYGYKRCCYQDRQAATRSSSAASSRGSIT